ncbi:MAG: UTP--glucose-1-phosphate uridylyltransferase [Anaerolineae bacterium]|nr:UTP--glucose-1-phosphate uridylyltransferase [Anaerolineae bacterium]
MRISRAVVTAAGRDQRNLPLQTLIDRDGAEKSVLEVLVDEAVSAGIDQVAVVVVPGDEVRYADVLRRHGGIVRFVPQEHALGYGHAVFCARDFVGDDPFLHLVGDHLYVSGELRTCAQQLVGVAEAESCAVSAVQATRESLLPYYGTVGGRRVAGRKDLYIIESVVEKPTPTQAEINLIVPGLRAGHYLCFFGMHVLTPTVMEILGRQVQEATADPTGGRRSVTLSDALAELAQREKYLALEEQAQRYDVGVKYGLFAAQLALALTGRDREEVLSRLVELLSLREMGRDAAAHLGTGA